ncbi:host specificity factor TipJ family phage tail protein, partial [Acinetobacter baumannii]
MIKIIYKQDPLSEDKTIEHAETLGQWLTSKYDHMPEHVRIFHTTSNMDHAEISFANEVTPKNAYELKQLDFLPGTFIVIENPKGMDPITLAWIVVASIVMGVAVALLMPVPSITQTNQNNNQSSSANNELSNRENKTRVNGRIADIYGAAHDTPDLITVPYKVYENNVEVEHVVGCIGRGHYKINGAYDGETNIVDIAGASVEVFRPGVDIVSGEPYFSLGTEITTPPLTVQHQTSANGQVLRPADTQSLEGTNYLHFAYPNEILRASANNTDLTTKFVSNDRVEITNASFTFNGQTYDLNGTYSVLSVADDRMTLSNPAAVNANWLKLKELNNQQTAALSPKISSIGEKWIGPFILDNVERSRVLCNFVATNGLYTVSSGGNQAAVNVTIEVEVTPVNESGAAIGNPMLKQIILKGSAKSRQTVGATLDMVTFQGRCSVRARRLTPTPAVTTVVDEVKWQALYGAYPLQSTMYEHETVFRARTYATTGALSVKSRKINFDLQRMLPTYKNGAMTTELYPTSSFADALVSMALDEKIGRRTIDEIDLENIYRTYNDVVDYFGTPLAAEFCTTIDDTNLSFEELVTNLCDAVFCTAYRQNNKLKLYFERPTDNSVMLFNFRNIIPDSYKHDLTFG